MIEWPGLKRTTMITSFQPPAMCRVTNQQTKLPRATSSLELDVETLPDHTADLGSEVSTLQGWWESRWKSQGSTQEKSCSSTWCAKGTLHGEERARVGPARLVTGRAVAAEAIQRL